MSKRRKKVRKREEERTENEHAHGVACPPDEPCEREGRPRFCSGQKQRCNSARSSNHWPNYSADSNQQKHIAQAFQRTLKIEASQEHRAEHGTGCISDSNR